MQVLNTEQDLDETVASVVLVHTPHFAQVVEKLSTRAVLQSKGHEMLCLECVVQVQHVRAVQVHHDVALVCYHAFLSALQQALFLHQLQGVEFTCGLESRQKYS